VPQDGHPSLTRARRGRAQEPPAEHAQEQQDENAAHIDLDGFELEKRRTPPSFPIDPTASS